MVISENGKRLIKSFEGCRLQAYYCPGGVLTIGWGHTGDVYPGQTITQQEADRLFDTDIVRYEIPVRAYNVDNQNKYDALVSFCYNCGPGALQDVMTSGDITGTMGLYVKGGGVTLPGLVRRRKEEIELYNTPASGDAVTNNNFGLGDKVKITGYFYSTGEEVPGWVKDNQYSIIELTAFKALLSDIVSWVNLDSLTKVEGSTGAGNSNKTYVVVSGDTLSGIADKFGTTWQELARINNIENPNLIQVGQLLQVTAGPGQPQEPQAVYYTVQPGDNLSLIADTYNTTWQEIANLNNIENPNLIYAGQQLRVK